VGHGGSSDFGDEELGDGARIDEVYGQRSPLSSMMVAESGLPMMGTGW
jgi:hypothetical protein